MRAEMFVFDAVRELCPDVEFSVIDYDPNRVNWIACPEDFVAPTASEIMEKAEFLFSEYQASVGGDAIAAKEAARQSAVSKLAALGLTVDEISAAFGLGGE